MCVFLSFLGCEPHMGYEQSRLYTMLPENRVNLGAMRLTLALHTVRNFLYQKQHKSKCSVWICEYRQISVNRSVDHFIAGRFDRCNC